jgi:hypothetical protein
MMGTRTQDQAAADIGWIVVVAADAAAFATAAVVDDWLIRWISLFAAVFFAFIIITDK